MKDLIILEKLSDDEFIAKDEVNEEYVVFKFDEIKIFKNLNEAREFLKSK